MRSIHPECSDSAAPDQSVAADVLLRQEPAEEEDEEDDEGGEEDDDVTTATRSEGYESKERALRATIQELRKMISAKTN